MTIAIIIGIIIVIVLIGASSGNNRQKKAQEEVSNANAKVVAAFSAGEITESHRDILLQRIPQDWEWRFNIDKKIEAFKFLKLRASALLAKYGDDIGNRLLN